MDVSFDFSGRNNDRPTYIRESGERSGLYADWTLIDLSNVCLDFDSQQGLWLSGGLISFLCDFNQDKIHSS